MALILAIGSAVTFGIADFLGGIASRRVATWSVVAVSQLAGLVPLVVLLPVLPSATYEIDDLAWGAAAGAAGALALTQFYRALAIGPMSVAAPITAVVNAALPVAVGVGLGERPAVVAWVGIGLGIPAIAMISRERSGHTQVTRGLVVAALAGGVGFGLFFVFLDRTGDGAGIIPLISARVASISLVLSLGVTTGRIARVPWPRLPVVAGAGVLDMTANALFLYAVREGLLALGSVVGAMYPASTIVLARLLLGERLQRVQVTGLALAGVAVACVALA